MQHNITYTGNLKKGLWQHTLKYIAAAGSVLIYFTKFQLV